MFKTYTETLPQKRKSVKSTGPTIEKKYSEH